MTRDESIRRAMQEMTKRVVQATQSPMNLSRWSCSLECGHEVWVTRVQRPKRAVCPTCGTRAL